jgi:hypothetical protein
LPVKALATWFMASFLMEQAGQTIKANNTRPLIEKNDFFMLFLHQTV